MPEALRDRAVDNLRYIRETMERAASFTSIPGWGGVAVGITAVAAAVIGAQMIERPATWLTVWLADAAVASLVGWSAMLVKAHRSGVSLTTGVARRFLVAYFAPMIAAAVLTLVLWRSGEVRPLPAVWLLLYGTSFVNSGAFSLRLIPLLGLSFMAFGVAAAFAPLWLGNVLLGTAFGGLHIVFGFIIARNYGG